MTGYLYTPGPVGEWLVVAATGRLLVARIDGDHGRAERCLAALDESTSVSHIVDILSAQGLDSTGPFALLFWVDGEMTERGLGVIVRGTPVVTVESAAGDVRVASGGAMTWSEQLVDGASGFAVATGATEERAEAGSGFSLRLPLVAGAVWATAVALDASAEAPTGSQGETAAATVAAELSDVDDVIDGATVIVPTRSRRREQASAGASEAPEAPKAPQRSETPEAPEVSAEPAGAVVEETRVFHTTTSKPSDDDEGHADDAALAGGGAAASGEPDSYDYLFGATIFRSVGQAAVAEEDEDAEGGGSAPVPASPAQPPAAGSVTSPAPTVGDHDGSTVFSADIQAARAQSRAQSASGGSSASAPTFASVPASAPASTPAPHAQTPAPDSQPGYLLVLPDGRPQELSAPVIIGRAPSVSNVPASVLPHLITISADDISRNHVRISVEGGTVVVTDLLSSNGTQVIQPGKPPLSLRGGEPTPVIVGTIVDLGSGITLRIVGA